MRIRSQTNLTVLVSQARPSIENLLIKCISRFRFLEQFDEVLQGSRKVTVVLDDPTGNSYVQALTDDGSVDPNLKIIRYHRSFDQNEELGLNDMKVEGYEQD